MLGKNKTLNWKSSCLRYFKERNHEIWNVHSNMFFDSFMWKKNWFKKKVLWDVKANCKLHQIQNKPKWI